METWNKSKLESQHEPSNIFLRMQPSSPVVSSRPISELPNSNYFNDSTAKLPTEFRRKYEQWQKMKNAPQSGLPPDRGKPSNYYSAQSRVRYWLYCWYKDGH